MPLVTLLFQGRHVTGTAGVLAGRHIGVRPVVFKSLDLPAAGGTPAVPVTCRPFSMTPPLKACSYVSSHGLGYFDVFCEVTITGNIKTRHNKLDIRIYA